MDRSPLSYNSRLAADIKRLLIPTAPQLLLNLVLGTLILLSLNARAIWHYFTRGIDESSRVELGDLIETRLPAVYQFFDSLTHGRLVQIVFWLFIGCITYIVIWLIGNFVTNIRNDIVADEYVHPKSYRRSAYWSNVLSRKVLFVCMVFVLGAYIYTSAKLTVLLADLCYQSILDLNQLKVAITIVGSLLAVALMLQVLWYLYRLVVNSWRLIYRDL